MPERNSPIGCILNTGRATGKPLQRAVASTLALLASLLWLAPAPAAAQPETSEAYFKRALQYTAQLRTVVTLPFEGDRKGAMRGAGFLVDAERGWIMTNSHVVSGSQALVQVGFTDNEFMDARRVYVDPFLDLAIVQVDPARTRGIQVPTLECDRMPQVGHPVGAFGHPWGLRYTGTRGIISGITSRFEFEVLQTDAPINQGNSGGPLISMENGRIVAINTMTIRGAQNTNFAISSVYACRILRLLQQGVDPSPPEMTWVTFRDVDERRMLRIARNFAPAGLALEPGDVVRGVVGVMERIDNDTQLVHALRGRLDNFRLNVVRGGKEIELAGRLPPAARVMERRGILVGGVDKLLTVLAKCCKPAPPDPIVGFVSRGRGVTVHRRDCPNVSRMPQERMIESAWGQPGGERFAVDLEVLAHDRQGLLRDISELLSREKVNVTATQTASRSDTAHMMFTVEVLDVAQVQRLLAAIGEVKGVIRVRRR